MTSVTAASGVSNIKWILPDQTNKIYLAKAARTICIGVGIVAFSAFYYQIYQNPSMLNPFSDQRSFNPWSDKSVWFNKEHLTGITMALSVTAHRVFNGLICQMEADQATSKKRVSLEH